MIESVFPSPHRTVANSISSATTLPQSTARWDYENKVTVTRHQYETWQPTQQFCEPLTAVTAIFDYASPDIFSRAVQAIRAAASEKSSSSLNRVSEIVSAALVVAYKLEEEGEAREASREIMAFVETFLSAGSVTEPNRLLAEAKVEKMTIRSLIGLIRSTAIARHKLPAWEHTYSRAWRRVEELDRVPENIFVGLPKPSEVVNAAVPS